MLVSLEEPLRLAWRGPPTPPGLCWRAARGTASPADEPLRLLLRELVQAAGLVRRIGVNLNQSVAKLNATGQRSGDLLAYARESLRRADHLDQVAELVRQRLR